MLWSVIRILLAVYVVFGLILVLFQRRFVYFPERQIELTPESIGLAHEDVFLEASDGVRINAWFVPGEPDGPVVLFCHGNAGNISHRLDTLQFYRSLGLSTLIFDYRGYGRSDGSPGEEGTHRDAEAAWRYLVEQRGVPPERIVILGRSLGGAVAARLAADHPPGALVVESAFTSVPDLAARMFPVYPVHLLARIRYNTLKCLRRVRCPVLVAHSRDDEMIPFRHGRRLFEAAPEPKEFLELRGGHNEGYRATARSYEQTLTGFLARHVRGGGDAPASQTRPGGSSP